MGCCSHNNILSLLHTCRYDNEFSYATRVCGLIQYIASEDQK